MTQVKQLLSQIAREHLLIQTLETRKSDSLDFHTVSVWAVEAALKAAFDAGHLSTETEEIDIEDVQEVRPDLSDEQAWEVLEEVKCKHDAEYGTSWTTLEICADELFPMSSPSDNSEGQP